MLIASKTFAQQVLEYHFALPKDLALSKGVELIYPFSNADTISAMKKFYNKYYADTHGRVFIFGINPGRFGSGVTGIGFTDPINLQNTCGIDNPFQKRTEVSSNFIYDVIQASGGPQDFFARYYFTAVSPVGFLKDGKNYNYYDDLELTVLLGDFLLNSISTQLKFGQLSTEIICIGRGKNLAYLHDLNKAHNLFSKIHVVPHPRWVMQYRRKEKERYVDEYLEVLSSVNTYAG